MKSVKKPAAKAAKSPAKAAPKKTVAKQAASEKKGAPAAAGAMVTEIDAEEMEAQQDAEEERAAISSGGGGSMAGLEAAAKAGASDASVSLKNFRHHPDMENFYRFIYENDLRFEALEILDKNFHDKELKKAAKLAKSKAN
jgi:hypothetical protein